MQTEKFRVFFKYGGHYETKSVEVVGSFNNWKRGMLVLDDDDGDNIWHGTIDLPSGDYQYKFVIDGTVFKLDEHNPNRALDANGHENSVISVGHAKLRGDVEHSAQNVDIFSSDTVYIKTAVNRNKFISSNMILVINDTQSYIPGYVLYCDEVYAYYFYKFKNPLCQEGFLYYFELKKEDGTLNYFGKTGLEESEWEVESFEFLSPVERVLTTPDWVKDAVFYQIFPERFCNGNPALNPHDVDDPESLPHNNSFYGGDLEGVIQKMEHFSRLGVNALYFNPIFEAASNHKYDTADYRKIDPHFGNEETFERLSNALKERGFHFILDGVFNHTGTDFFAFKDIMHNGESSKYKNWYYIHKFPLYENGKANYLSWWNFPSLPKLNVDNPQVKKYLLETASYWMKKGADGWRLDVPNEIGHWFWKEFREAVKSTNPEGYIVGEIWQDGSDWLSGDEFDSVMNYRFRDACIDFFALRQSDSQRFVCEIGKQIYDYPMQANFAMFNLLSSHDTARYYTVTGCNKNALKLTLAFQFTTMGSPSIYYGEEIGMEGKKDPDNRRMMVWDEGCWDHEIFDFYQNLIKIRNENEVLRRGDIRFILSKDMVIGFERFIGDNKLLVFINNSEENINVDVTKFFGNGDFVDISKDYPLKRKRAYTLYGNEFVILKKVKER